MTGDRGHECLFLPDVAQGGELVLEVEVVPADDAVLDQPVARLGDLLILLLGLQEFPALPIATSRVKRLASSTRPSCCSTA